MADDPKSFLDAALKSLLAAVLARKQALDKYADWKTKEKRRVANARCEAEAKRQQDIDRAWSTQKYNLETAVTKMNRSLAAQHLEFKLVKDRNPKDVEPKIDLRLFEGGVQKLSANITLSSEGAVRIITKGKIFGTKTLRTLDVSDTEFDYSETMVGLLEQLYPKWCIFRWTKPDPM